MISTDRKIFDRNSAVHARMIEYSREFEEMIIVIFSRREQGLKAFENGKIRVYPTSSTSRLFYIKDAIRISRGVLGKDNLSEARADQGEAFDASQWLITTQDPFETGLAGLTLKKRYGISLLTQIHTDLYSPYFCKFSFLNRIRLLIANIVIPQSDTVRVVSERIRKDVIARFSAFAGSASQVVVRPIAVNTEAIKNAPVITSLREKNPAFRKIVIMASRLEPEKNIFFALKAWREVIKSLPDAGLVIIGEGSQQAAISRYIAEHFKGGHVVMLPWQSDMASMYKTSDLFLNTSYYEGYGMTLVEAKAAGLQTISTDVGVAPEIGATIIAHDDVPALAAAIVQRLK